MHCSGRFSHVNSAPLTEETFVALNIVALHQVGQTCLISSRWAGSETSIQFSLCCHIGMYRQRCIGTRKAAATFYVISQQRVCQKTIEQPCSHRILIIRSVGAYHIFSIYNWIEERAPSSLHMTLVLLAY